MLDGYGPMLMKGLAGTLGVAAGAYCLALLFGIVGATAKLAGGRISKGAAEAYTFVIRGTPELILLLLVFFAVPTMVQTIVRSLSPEYANFRLDLDPFTSAVIALGFIYGAFATEVFRGAIQAIPVGQIEAARAYGMYGRTLGVRVVLPQLMRFALSGLSYLWLVVIKATALASVIQVFELMRAANLAAGATSKPFTFFLAAGGIYLTITAISLICIKYIESYSFRGTEQGAK
jgi:His/Glu/Gln/Arg/opine family amino acid ABC transporter permease subunit